jgi:hypothetical protein
VARFSLCAWTMKMNVTVDGQVYTITTDAELLSLIFSIETMRRLAA